jgi:hypothetical protein
MRDETVAEIVEEAVLPAAARGADQPDRGSLLGEVVRDKAPLRAGRPAPLGEFHRWLTENPRRSRGSRGAGARGGRRTRVNDSSSPRSKEVLKWVAEIRDDPHHQARIALDDLLADLSDDLPHDEATMERAERLKVRILDHPQLMETVLSLWRAFLSALSRRWRPGRGILRRGSRPSWRSSPSGSSPSRTSASRLDGYVADLAAFAREPVRHRADRRDQPHHRPLGRQGDRRRGWSCSSGRDLQFIRINGTIVGGLVGSVIHAVAVLVG